MSLRKFAEICDLNYKTIYKIERGESSTTIAVLEKIAKALGVSLSSLVNEEEQKVKPVESKKVSISEAIQTLETIVKQPLKQRDRELLRQAFKWADEALCEKQV